MLRVQDMKTIQQEWEGFSAMVFAKMNPSPVQVEEMKRASFAGATSMLFAVKRLGDPDVPDDVGVQYLEDRETEAKEFYSDLIKRYAEGN